MIESKKPGLFIRHERQFEVGDRVETFNHCVGTVVRVDRDKIGVFIVVRLDILPREFAYEPCDLKLIE
ncbi:hypothetical protein [Desulfosporosinus shakirovi]|uniref:hypothetical protein n=1 Tax=Desulfosporosinus shakirovi TaxID=2885154 RepID=UPI001E55EBB7|nr:hypothetical protein [Desulfosporosinus sp. SRJS8]MCB8818583.1 hypothetical protein [Desulfosporosinus sp. SRJS8]